MEKAVTVACIRNPLDPVASREIRTFQSGLTISDYWREFFPLAPPDFPIVSSINGQIVENDQAILLPGDSLAFLRRPPWRRGWKRPPGDGCHAGRCCGGGLFGPCGRRGLWGFTQGTAGFAAVSALVSTGITVAGGLLGPSPVSDPGSNDSGVIRRRVIFSYVCLDPWRKRYD